ncbi:MAG: hypothetical protein ABL951_04025, partial [Alphaproteobacteria bacterium]
MASKKQTTSAPAGNEPAASAESTGMLAGVPPYKPKEYVAQIASEAASKPKQDYKAQQTATAGDGKKPAQPYNPDAPAKPLVWNPQEGYQADGINVKLLDLEATTWVKTYQAALALTCSIIADDDYSNFKISETELDEWKKTIVHYYRATGKQPILPPWAQVAMGGLFVTLPIVAKTKKVMAKKRKERLIEEATLFAEAQPEATTQKKPIITP